MHAARMQTERQLCVTTTHGAQCSLCREARGYSREMLAENTVEHCATQPGRCATDYPKAQPGMLQSVGS